MLEVDQVHKDKIKPTEKTLLSSLNTESTSSNVEEMDEYINFIQFLAAKGEAKDNSDWYIKIEEEYLTDTAVIFDMQNKRHQK